MYNNKFATPVKAKHGLLGSSVKVLPIDSLGRVDEVVYPVAGTNVVTTNMSIRDKSVVERISETKTDNVTQPSGRRYISFLASVRTEHSTLGSSDDSFLLSDETLGLVEGLIQTAIEKEFCEGTISKTIDKNHNRFLKSDLAQAVSNSPGSLGTMVGALEQRFSSKYGIQPTLHVPSSLVSYGNIFKEDKSGVLRTRLGSPVVAGSGYGGSTLPATTETIYATGPITTCIGEINETSLTKVIDTNTNTIIAVWEVPVAVVWTTEGILKVDITL